MQKGRMTTTDPTLAATNTRSAAPTASPASRSGPVRFLQSACAAALFFLIAVVTRQGLAPCGAATTPDSLCYLEAADNVRSGHGLVLNAYSLEPASAFKPFTSWPPLYPLTLSVFPSNNGIGRDAAARLSVLALTLCVLLLFIILRPHVGAPTALLTGVVFQLAPSTLTVFAHAWSETLFTPLSLAACGALFLYFQSPSAGMGYLPRMLLLTACLCALVCCRYAGIVFAVWLPVAWYAARRRPFAAAAITLSAAIYMATLGFLALRNYSLAGTPTGLALPSSTKGMLANLHDLALSFSLVVPSGWRSAALVLIGLLAGWVLARRLQRPDEQARSAPDASTRRLLAVCLLVAAGYLGGMVLLRTFRGFDPLEIRCVGPVMPLILAALALVTRTAWMKRADAGWAVPVTSLCAALWVLPAVQGVAAYRGVLDEIVSYGQPRFLASPGVHYMNYTWPAVRDRAAALAVPDSDAESRAVRAFASLGVDTDTTIVTEFPQVVRFLTGAHVKQYPGTALPATQTLNAISGKAFLVLTRPESVPRLDAALGGRAAALRIVSPGLPRNWFVVPLPLRAGGTDTPVPSQL